MSKKRPLITGAWLHAGPLKGEPLTREKVLEVCAKLFDNGLDEHAQIWTASIDELWLRHGLCKWQQYNCLVVYGMDSPQPDIVRAALAWGNLRLMQREFLED